MSMIDKDCTSGTISTFYTETNPWLLCGKSLRSEAHFGNLIIGRLSIPKKYQLHLFWVAYRHEFDCNIHLKVHFYSVPIFPR